MLPIQSEVGWTSETVRTVWKRKKYFTHVRIRTPDCPARSLVIIPIEPSQLLLGFIFACILLRFQIRVLQTTLNYFYDVRSFSVNKLVTINSGKKELLKLHEKSTFDIDVMT